MLDLRHYRYIAAVARNLSFRLAAAELGVSVPTLSVQISHAEDYLGMQIFARTSRKVWLTRNGTVFMAAVDDVLQSARAAEDLGRNLTRGMTGELRVGYVGSAAYAGILQKMVGRFHSCFPTATITAEEHVMEDLPRMVSDHRIDVALVRAPVELPPDLCGYALTTDHFVAALSQDLQVAGAGLPLRAAALRDVPFIVPEQEFGTLEVARRGKFEPHVVSTPGSLISVLTQVALKRAVAIIPNMLRTSIHLEGVEFRDIEGPAIPSGIVGIVRADEDIPLVQNAIAVTAEMQAEMWREKGVTG
ncbi:LysR family transcriptional regulator [Rhodobacteraceae bacterium]|nr:LysR family transcriptional regulator [Paracoccaceae bacterium]